MRRCWSLVAGLFALLVGMGSSCHADPPIFTSSDDDDNGTPMQAEGEVIITEVMANPNRVSDQKGEWFELYNTSSSEVSLEGWTVSDSSETSFTIEDLTIGGGEHAVLGLDDLTEENGGVTLDFQYPEEFTLANNGETITLKNADGAIVDSITYEKAPDGASLSLDPSKYSAEENDKAENFCATRFSSIKDGGDLGTPGKLNDVCFIQASAGDLVITEIMAEPAAAYGDWGKYFEIYNTTSSDVKLDGWTIEDGEGDKYTISSGGSLKVGAKSYVVLGAHSESSENGGVSLDYVYGSAIVLSLDSPTLTILADGTVVDTVIYDKTAGFPTHEEGISLQLDPSKDDATANDNGANWCSSDTEMTSGEKGTPGEENTSCTTSS